MSTYFIKSDHSTQSKQNEQWIYYTLKQTKLRALTIFKIPTAITVNLTHKNNYNDYKITSLYNSQKL